MDGKRLSLLMIAALGGWFLIDMIDVKDRRKVDGQVEASAFDSVLKGREIDEHLRLNGTLSTRVARVAAWARGISLDDVSSSLRGLHALPPGLLRDVAKSILAERMAQVDSYAALLFSRELNLDVKTRSRLIQELPFERLVELLQREPWLETLIVEALAATDPEKAFALVQQAGGLEPQAAGMIVRGFVERHGFQRAAEMATQFSGRGARSRAATQLVQLWTSENPRDAVDWIENCPDPELRIPLLFGWEGQVVDNDHDEAMALISEVDSLNTRASVTYRSAAAVASSDPAKAFARLAGIDLSDSTLLQMAQGLSRVVAENLPAPEAPMQALERLEAFARERGFAESAKYAEIRLKTYEETFGRWAGQDGDTAREHAESLTDPELRDAAFRGMAKTTSTDP